MLSINTYFARGRFLLTIQQFFPPFGFGLVSRTDPDDPQNDEAEADTPILVEAT